jgi:hypothetical protein
MGEAVELYKAVKRARASRTEREPLHPVRNHLIGLCGCNPCKFVHFFHAVPQLNIEHCSSCGSPSNHAIVLLFAYRPRAALSRSRNADDAWITLKPIFCNFNRM